MVKFIRNKFYVLIVMVFIISLTGCNSGNKKVLSGNSTTNITSQQWIEDIDYLTKNLPKVHKNLYHSIKKEDFNKEIENLKNDVPKLAVDFVDQTKAIFYGEPSGGNVNGYGDIKNLVLPNSKLEISYSTKYFKLSDKFKENFIPDVMVDQNFNDYKQGIDDVYESIKNYKG